LDSRLKYAESPERPARVSQKGKESLAQSLISPKSVWGQSLWIAILWTAWAFCLATLQGVIYPFPDFVSNFAFWIPFSQQPNPRASVVLLGALLQVLTGAAFGLLLAFRLGWMTPRFPRSYIAALTGIWMVQVVVKWWATGALAFNYVFSLGPDTGSLLRSELTAGIFSAVAAGYLTARLLDRAERPLRRNEMAAIVSGYTAAMIVACLFRLLLGEYPYSLSRPIVLVLPLLLFAIIGNGVVFWQLRES